MSRGDEVEFRRRTFPQSNGQVKVEIEVRVADRLLGKIVQVQRQWWQYRAVESNVASKVYSTAWECKQEVADQVAGERSKGTSEGEG